MEKLPGLLLWSKWKRPASIPYPNIWHRFTTKSKNGKIYNIKIVDSTPDRFEEIGEFMVKYFYSNEPMSTSLKLLEDEISLHNYQLIQRAVLDQHVSLIAVLDEDVPKPEIVGVQKLLVDVKGDESLDSSKVPGDFVQKLYKLFNDVEMNHDPFEIFGTDTIIRGYGLCVKSEYRGLDIGYNLIFTIEKLAKAFDIKAFVVWYSNIRSQNIAQRFEFKMLNEIIYNEYKDDQGQIIFPVEGTKSLKFVGMEFV